MGFSPIFLGLNIAKSDIFWSNLVPRAFCYIHIGTNMTKGPRDDVAFGPN